MGLLMLGAGGEVGKASVRTCSGWSLNGAVWGVGGAAILFLVRCILCRRVLLAAVLAFAVNDICVRDRAYEQKG